MHKSFQHFAMGKCPLSAEMDHEIIKWVSNISAVTFKGHAADGAQIKAMKYVAVLLSAR